MAKLQEITLAGFDGGDDDTDHLVVWVAGTEDAVAALVEGTGATFCGPVDGADVSDADFTLPGDADALSARIAEQDAALGASAPKA